jgi:hypothetical protein
MHRRHVSLNSNYMRVYLVLAEICREEEVWILMKAEQVWRQVWVYHCILAVVAVRPSARKTVGLSAFLGPTRSPTMLG